MGSAFDEQGETHGVERPSTGQSGVSGLRRRTDGGLDFDAIEADLSRQLSDVPRLFTERPTRPAPPMTPDLRSGPADAESVTPIRPTPGILPPPPRTPHPESLAPLGRSPTPAQASRDEGHDLMMAALVETRALKSGLKRLLHGASVFATIVVVLLAMLVLQTGTSSARSTPTAPPPVTAARAPSPEKKHEVAEIVLTTSPRSAMFRIDQGPWLVGPYVAQVPKDDREHDVYVAANGYLPRAVKVRFTKDTLFDIVLQRESAGRPHPKAGHGF